MANAGSKGGTVWANPLNAHREDLGPASGRIAIYCDSGPVGAASSYRVLFSRDILGIYQALKHPVWMVRGSRGDFVDYHHVSRVKNQPNWSFGVFQTGAFPQFEALAQVTASYDAFLSNVAHLSG